jgi:hypothetical protein
VISDPISTCTAHIVISGGAHRLEVSCVDQYAGGLLLEMCDGCSHWSIRALTAYAGRPLRPTYAGLDG